ncbi:SAF domain-containing protein [Cellulomonas rhizosphaerae]|uniref:Flagellar biosynthesis protein FlgA n=1 Tax=Cellulomonas rhizosphaerae TaxID=2293719 RepID=A0A413RMD9_9CELL|nr:SAF domain-containing protein [Cellulomonas rhizosphaerae]RHA41653.1 flagellar biosynthesis protein FlgA [Cellulomonas rhizosphaerae]
MATDIGKASQQDGVTERRRAREARGLGPAGGAAAGDRLPKAPRERRPLLAVLAVLLIVGGAAIAGLFALRQDSRVPMLQLAHDVAAGSAITDGDLVTTQVAAEGTALVPAGAKDQVVGRYARVPLVSGQLLDSTMLTDTAPLQPGSVAVGAALADGRMPASGLEPGDVVQLVQVGDSEGTVLVPDARVSSVRTSDSVNAGATIVTLIVDEASGAKVAAVAADGALAVTLVSRGTPIGEDG